MDGNYKEGEARDGQAANERFGSPQVPPWFE